VTAEYCYPLTVTDQMSRYLLACEAFESTKEVGVFEAFRRLFAEHGLPRAIRSDNGLPFASPNGLYNLSKLSVWWLTDDRGSCRPPKPAANAMPAPARAPTPSFSQSSIYSST
jgi:hypothetical protein